MQLEIRRLGRTTVGHAARQAWHRATEGLGPYADWVFVVEDDRWLFNTMTEQIAAHGRLDHRFAIWDRPPWPDGRIYFFCHFFYLQRFLRTFWGAERKRKVVLFTHYDDQGGPLDQLVRDLLECEVVFCLSTGWRGWLIEHGIPSDRIRIVLGAADQRFVAGRSREPVVGSCAGYYPRKRGEILFELVRRMPDVRFILLGRRWGRHPGFADVAWRSNFRYVTTTYEHYPAVYRQMRVFLNTTRLDGGPAALLEAMASDVLPVSSRTGFAPDLIRHGENGLLFDTDASVEEVEGLVRRALDLDLPVRGTVEHLTWERYARLIIDAVEGSA